LKTAAFFTLSLYLITYKYMLHEVNLFGRQELNSTSMAVNIFVSSMDSQKKPWIINFKSSSNSQTLVRLIPVKS